MAQGVRSSGAQPLTISATSATKSKGWKAIEVAVSCCRWSSDGFQCDVYCYEDVHGGYTTHVAGWRRPKRVTSLDFSND